METLVRHPLWDLGDVIVRAEGALARLPDAPVRVVGRLSLGPAVAEHHLAVALVDLSAAGSPRLAMLNGDEMMCAASLPKIAILLGAFVQAERGTLVLDEPTRFYYLLDRGELVSPELTRQMKAALADPGIRHKFVKGLESKPDARLYRKSGTWRQFHSDSALVEGRRRRYILVGIAEDPRGGEWLERIAAPLHDLVAAGQSSEAGR